MAVLSRRHRNVLLILLYNTPSLRFNYCVLLSCNQIDKIHRFFFIKFDCGEVRMKSYEPQSEPITAYAVEDPVTIVPVAVPVTVSEEFVVPTAPPLHSTIQNSIEQALMPDAPLSFETKQIPVYFEQCPSLCCAYNLYYCTSYSECVGFKGNCVLCCFESEDFCLKYVEDNQKTNCICASRDVECVNCADFCKCYRQCFCCEILCSCPYDGTYRTTNVIYRSIPDRTEIPANNNNIICQ